MGVALGVSAGMWVCPSAEVSFPAGCGAELFPGAGAAASITKCGPGARAAQELGIIALETYSITGRVYCTYTHGAPQSLGMLAQVVIVGEVRVLGLVLCLV